MKTYLKSTFVTLAILGFASCNFATDATPPDSPVYLTDGNQCPESDPECRVTDEPVPDDFSEPQMDTKSETKDEPIEGVISLNDLKKMDADEDPAGQNTDQNTADPDMPTQHDPKDEDSGTTDSGQASSDDHSDVCYYDDDGNPVSHEQVTQACRTHFPEDDTGFETCMEDHCSK